jgi:hypothetical protein
MCELSLDLVSPCNLSLCNRKKTTADIVSQSSSQGKWCREAVSFERRGFLQYTFVSIPDSYYIRESLKD